MKNAQVENVETSQAVAIRPAEELSQALPPEEINRLPVTAAQAKVDAIANLTMKAYERAATLTITKDEAEKLAADFPDEAFKPGAAGKEHLIYIEHAFLRDRLSEVFGMGQWAIIPRNRWAEDFVTQRGTPGSRVYVEAMLVIRGCFVAEAVGAMEYYPKNESQNYGDAVEGAKTAAFRRCAKELGVGLQAWKKDWCDAWWARRRGGRDFSKGTPMAQRAAAQKVQNVPAEPSATKNPSAPAPASKPTQRPPPTEVTRNWMIETLGKEGLTDFAVEYFQKLRDPSVIFDVEGIEEIPLRFVPNTHEQMRCLIAAVKDFANGDEPKHAFPAHEMPLPERMAKPTRKPESAKPPQPTARKDDEAWRDFIVPIPNKGQKRADYILNPDTIGSLYDQCKSGTEEACKRLWGFVNHFEPKPWTGRDGKQYPPSDTDVEFRNALDDFKEWHSHNGKDTIGQVPEPIEETTPLD